MLQITQVLPSSALREPLWHQEWVYSMNQPTTDVLLTCFTRPMKSRNLENASRFFIHHTRCGHRPIDIHQVFPLSPPETNAAPPQAWKLPKSGPIFTTTKAKSTPEMPTFSLPLDPPPHRLFHAI